MTTKRDPDATRDGPTRRTFPKGSAALAGPTGLADRGRAAGGAADEPPWYPNRPWTG
jgi:hypothetical protein